MTQQLPEYITETAEGDYQVTLSKAVDIDGAKVSVLTLREPTVQDMLAAELQSKGQGAAQQEINLLANLCDVAPEHIKSMTLKNYSRLQEAFKLFTS